jgi:hypothetical protein
MNLEKATPYLVIANLFFSLVAVILAAASCWVAAGESARAERLGAYVAEQNLRHRTMLTEQQNEFKARWLEALERR